MYSKTKFVKCLQIRKKESKPTTNILLKPYFQWEIQGLTQSTQSDNQKIPRRVSIMALRVHKIKNVTTLAHIKNKV